MTDRPRALLLAENCNPERPSLPIVAYKYALEIARLADVTLVTQVRNRPAFEKAAPTGLRVEFLDTEYVAGPLHRFAMRLRGGAEVAWSTSVMMQYLPYLAFERDALRMFRDDLRAGRFDIVHRIAPMTPTLPSYVAGRTSQPFVLGPLNGNLDWPAAFRAEQLRERERARVLRRLYKLMPYARRTQARADLILSAFPHTTADLTAARPGRVINFPEVGFDPAIFHADGRTAPFAGLRDGMGPARFLYAGRLVPYKLPEAAIRAMAGSRALAPHHLHIVGDGPERARLEALVADLDLGARVHFEGKTDQAGVADWLRRCDAFVFPSIRELGAGVVVEAMACGAPCVVIDYGAPGHLCGQGRGVTLPLGSLEDIVGRVRTALEGMVADPDGAVEMAERARAHVEETYTWAHKARHTVGFYRDLLEGRLPDQPGPYT